MTADDETRASRGINGGSADPPRPNPGLPAWQPPGGGPGAKNRPARATPTAGAPADTAAIHARAPGAGDTAARSAADSRHPPRWLPRALAMTVAAVFIGIFLWRALGSLGALLVNVLISFFLMLALEPIVVWLVKHKWRRGAAAGVALLGAILLVLVLLALFGNLFVQQMIQLVQTIPDLYSDAQKWIESHLDVQVPSSEELVQQGMARFGPNITSGVVLVGTTLLGGLFAVTTIMLVTYYLLAAGPKLRVAICRWLPPDRQQEVLNIWEISQRKVSDFINSRLVLAALSSVFTFAFLAILGTPYSLPLAVFTGVVSQFVPTIGTYLGGALPVVVALAAQGLPQAIAVLLFIIGYQQIENLIFAPRVSARAMKMNPAVSFLVVLGFAAVFGPIGAFLALPIAATVQAVADTYLERHELIESHMLHDPEPEDHGDRRWHGVESGADADAVAASAAEEAAAAEREAAEDRAAGRDDERR